MSKKYLLLDILRKNDMHIRAELIERKHTKYLKELVQLINKEKMVIVSGMRFMGKTDLIRRLIEQTNVENHSFYFNTDLDREKRVQNHKDLQDLLTLKEENGNTLKFLFLQNISQIPGIKNFLASIYKKEYKIIIIGNDIKIPSIPEIEVKNTIKISFNEYLSNSNITNISHINNTIIKNRYIKLLTEKIILEDIIKLKSIYNVGLYYVIITILSQQKGYISLREGYRIVNQIENCSLKTYMDYVEYSEQAKIFKSVFLYDLKKKHTINTNVRYMFGDIAIRNSLSDFHTDTSLLRENYLYNILDGNNHKVYGGKMNSFNFIFYTEKDRKTYAFHISEEVEKNEFKKELHKLEKVPTDKQVLIVSSYDELSIKKKNYGSLDIVTLDDIRTYIENLS